MKGERFGRLTAIEPTDARRASSVVWKCRCDCGKEVYVTAKHLAHGGVRSCGCQRSDEARKTLIEIDRPRLGLVDGTNLSRLAATKPQKNNKTGVRGVIRLPDGRFEAFIHLKGKRIRVGRYFTLNEAQAEREKAVEKYFKPLLDEWEAQKRDRNGQK